MEDFQKLKQDLIESYNRAAKERDALMKEDWKVEQRDAFLQHMRSSSVRNLLEIGAGTGQDGAFFQEQGFDVTCTDMSPAMVEQCKNKGLTAYVMDFTDLQFPDGSFNAVWALNCLLHVPKNVINTVLFELKRVLRDGGLFYMGVYGGHNSEGIWEDDRYTPKRFFSFYDDEALQNLVSQYFDVISFVTLPHTEHLNFQSLVMQKAK